jgi:DNA-directed RNA polymerase specialized sigma24 family protein
MTSIESTGTWVVGALAADPEAPAGYPSDGDPPDTDVQLWRLAGAGSQAAFGDLFDRHLRAVWNHCYRLTGSHSQAEDLAANTFLVAWRRRSDVALVRDSALPWLFTVAGNLNRNEHRRSVRFLRAVRRTPAELATIDRSGGWTKPNGRRLDVPAAAVFAVDRPASVDRSSPAGQQLQACLDTVTARIGPVLDEASWQPGAAVDNGVDTHLVITVNDKAVAVCLIKPNYADGFWFAGSSTPEDTAVLNRSPS